MNRCAFVLCARWWSGCFWVTVAVNVVIALQHLSFLDETPAKTIVKRGSQSSWFREACRWDGLELDLLTTQARRFLAGGSRESSILGGVAPHSSGPSLLARRPHLCHTFQIPHPHHSPPQGPPVVGLSHSDRMVENSLALVTHGILLA